MMSRRDKLRSDFLAAEARRVFCSHVWIDPAEPPIQRAPYSPVIGDKPREMKAGTTYRCQNGCGATLTPKAKP